MGALASRARRRAAGMNFRAPPAAENRYVKDLRGLFRAFHVEALKFADAHHALKLDAEPEGWEAWLAKILPVVAKHAGPMFDRMAARVSKANAETMRKMGISSHDVRLGLALQIAREKNIALVEDAGRAYADQVREIFSDPESLSLRVEELQAKLVERRDVSESRAELIARDQTLKLNGQINELRQTNAGITSYVWSTSRDERVREEHAALEGQVFGWNDPPEPGHPGQDFQCRCIPIPVVGDES